MKYKVIRHVPEPFEESFDTLDEAKQYIAINFPDYCGGEVTGAGANCCCIYRWGGYREGIEIYVVKDGADAAAL